MTEIPEAAFHGIAESSPAPRTKISMTMALDSLREQVLATAEAKAEFERQRAIRDQLIVDARAGFVPVATIMRITELSRDRVSKITNRKGAER